MKDAVIIYSGGLDSTTLLYEERERVALAVTFDYGSNHAAHEIACARHHCALLGIEHLVIELGFMGRYFQSSLLSGADAIPSGNYDEENMKSTVVPSENRHRQTAACSRDYAFCIFSELFLFVLLAKVPFFRYYFISLTSDSVGFVCFIALISL